MGNLPAQPLNVRPSSNLGGAVYSPALKAWFLIEDAGLSNVTRVPQARIVARPAADSPLNQLALTVGDAIRALDGIPVGDKRELENHTADTDVQYIKGGSPRVRIGQIMIGSPFQNSLTVVAINNASNQPLSVYVRWNRGASKRLVLQPGQTVVESTTGHNQTAQMAYYPDLSRADLSSQIVSLKTTNVALSRQPVAQDAHWVKKLHVSQGRMLAID